MLRLCGANYVYLHHQPKDIIKWQPFKHLLEFQQKR